MSVFSSAPVAIRAQIAEPRDFYVDGDSISGKVLLVVSKTDCYVRSLRVELVCMEKVDLRPHGKEELLEKYRGTKSVAQNEHVHPGRHVYRYAVRVPDNKHGSYPPSYDAGDASNCGIHWYIQASAEIEMEGGTIRTVEDTTHIRVFWQPTDRELMFLGQHIVNNYTFKGVTYYIENPIWFSQAPDVCDVKVVLELHKPAVVRSVEIYWETCLIMFAEFTSKSFVRRTHIKTIRVDELVTKLELDGASGGWQIKGPLPTSFSSGRMRLQHNFFIKLEWASPPRHIKKVLHMFLASPRRKDTENVPPSYTTTESP